MVGIEENEFTKSGGALAAKQLRIKLRSKGSSDNGPRSILGGPQITNHCRCVRAAYI